MNKQPADGIAGAKPPPGFSDPPSSLSNPVFAARLMVPLGILILVFFSGPLLLLAFLHHQHNEQQLHAFAERIQEEFTEDVKNQTDGLAMLAHSMAVDSRLREGLARRQSVVLAHISQEAFTRLNQHHGVDALLFLDPDRVCLFRMHDPQRHGDLIERRCVWEAWRTREMAIGLEVSRMGSLSLHAVKPVFHEDRLAGFIEIGRSLDSILDSLRERTGVELVLRINKAKLAPARWAEGMRLLGREARWDRLPEHAISYATSPQALEMASIDPAGGGSLAGHRGQPWKPVFLPLENVGGERLGHLSAFIQTQQASRQLRGQILLSAAATFGLAVVLFAFIFYLLRRAERDVAARQRALATSEERTRAIIHLLPDIIIQTNEDGLYLEIFCADESRLFLPRNELIGRRIEDLLPPEPAALIMAHIRSAIRNHAFQALEYQLPVPAGHIYFEARILPSGHREALILIRDITDRKHFENSLRESEDKFKSIISNIPGAFYRRHLDRKRTLRYISPEIQELCGYPPEDFIDHRVRTLESIIHPEDLPTVNRAIEVAILNGSPWSCEYRLLCADGQECWVSEQGRSAVFKSGPSRIVHLDGFISDIRERKRMEAQNVEMQTTLLQANKLEAIGQLAAGVAHEINTPIQFISNNIAFLQKAFTDILHLATTHQRLLRDSAAAEKENDRYAQMWPMTEKIDLDFLIEEIPKSLNESTEGIQRIIHIIQAMRDFSHPGSSELTPEDINNSLRNTVTICRNEWKQVAEVEMDLAPELPRVLCHIGSINQVFVILLVNAAQAIQEAVRDGYAPSGRIVLQTREDNGQVVIRVIDNGPGIPPSVQAHIFEPFFTTKDVGKGTGQGLYMARNIIVKEHGGTIRFQTTPGKGTEFILTLPADPTPRT